MHTLWILACFFCAVSLACPAPLCTAQVEGSGPCELGGIIFSDFSVVTIGTPNTTDNQVTFTASGNGFVITSDAGSFGVDGLGVAIYNLTYVATVLAPRVLTGVLASVSGSSTLGSLALFTKSVTTNPGGAPLDASIGFASVNGIDFPVGTDALIWPGQLSVSVQDVITVANLGGTASVISVSNTPFSPVPEPATMVPIGLGLLGLVSLGRRDLAVINPLLGPAKAVALRFQSAVRAILSFVATERLDEPTELKVGDLV